MLTQSVFILILCSFSCVVIDLERLSKDLSKLLFGFVPYLTLYVLQGFKIMYPMVILLCYKILKSIITDA